MAISTVGVGYQFLPPVIRPDPNATSGTSPDTSRAGTAGTAPVQSADVAAPAPEATVTQGSTGKHLLRIVV